MQRKDETRQGAVKYLGMLLIQRIIGIALLLLAAGTVRDARAAVYLSLYLVFSIAACAMMFRGHQETLSERGKKQENTKPWDKVLLPVYVLLAYYGIYVVAGLGVRFEWKQLSAGWFYLGTAVYLVSGIFTVWPVLENKHFESTARIQENRSQTVVTTGPYRFVRHPGYLGIVLWALATTLMFGTIPVGAVSAAIILVIWVRTYLEDTMLRKELDGYAAYADAVRYRLIPFIW